MMSRTLSNWKTTVGLIGVVLFCLMAPPLWAADTQRSIPLGESTIKLGVTPYADQFATNALAELLLEKLGYNVQTTQATVGIGFAGVAGGDIDAYLNAWLPVIHGAYWDRYRDKLVKLSLLYKPTAAGWAVPDYVPKDVLGSIPDLKKQKVKKRLGGRITGIGAGAGLTRASRKALEKYGLSDYTLQTSSGPGMTAALARAIERKEWIVVTAWNPHWLWARWDMRYLEDPKNHFNKGRVYAVTRPSFSERFPRATAFLKNFQVPVSHVEQIMNMADKLQSSGKTNDPYAVAAKRYIENHPDLVEKWLQFGQQSAGTKSAQSG